MRTWERLRKMKAWLDDEICEGREFKSPKPSTGSNAVYGPNIKDFTMARPRVFLGWQPGRPNEPGKVDPKDPFSVCPALTIMPSLDYARYIQEHRFDRYQGIHRSQNMGQGVSAQILFGIYEPGIRLPGFVESLEQGNPDMGLLQDGTEAGLQTLLEWMDDCIELFLRERTVPGTDLILDDDNFTYSLFTDQAYIVDRRPIYYGFLNVPFKGYANYGSDKGYRSRIDKLLDGD
ncbi:MAG: hypothetical protein IJP78_07835 [Clostridia bacterium]|nr:hypothetical protein [Clostridia bacterium]